MSVIVIPCNLGKAIWLERFLNTARGDIPIVLGTSTNEEAKWFEDKLRGKPNSKNIIAYLSCEQYGKDIGIDAAPLPHNPAVINVKKFLTLHYCLERGYDSMMCIDSDSEIVTSTNEAINRVFKNHVKREFYGCPSDKGYVSINRECRALFTDEDQRTITNLTDDCKIYTWFHDAPFYTKNDLRDFFEYMSSTHGSLNNFFTRLGRNTFDYILYTYFLVAKKNAKLINYASIGINNLPEFLTWDETEKIFQEYNYRPAWIPKAEFNRNKNRTTDIHLVCHTDR